MSATGSQVSSDTDFGRLGVLVLLAVCGALVFGAVFSRVYVNQTSPRTGASSTKLLLKNLAAQLDVFRSHCGRYPTLAEGIEALHRRPPGDDLTASWAGPYVKDAPRDPWGSTIRYQIEANRDNYRNWSPGPDQTDATQDDIDLWKPKR